MRCWVGKKTFVRCNGGRLVYLEREGGEEGQVGWMGERHTAEPQVGLRGRSSLLRAAMRHAL